MDAKEAKKLGMAAIEKVCFHFELLDTKNTAERWLSPLDEGHTIHLGAPLDNALGMVHTVMIFACGFIDVRTFPEPILTDPENRTQCMRVMELLNYINLNLHRGCCFLTTQTGDISVGERISYRVFEQFPETLTGAVNAEYECFHDFGDAIRGCAHGSLSASSAMALMEEKWGW